MKSRNSCIELERIQDKMPPASLVAEQAVLGTCISYPDRVLESNLKPNMFFKKDHQILFETILRLAGQGSCDLISITDELRVNGYLDKLGGPSYLMSIGSSVVTDRLFQSHELIVREKYILREYIRLSNELINLAYSENLDSSIEHVESKILNLSCQIQPTDPVRLGNCVKSLIDGIQKMQNGDETSLGVRSGYRTIDKVMGGWHSGNLIVVAGRPGMGKTSLALSFAQNAAANGFPTAFFSLEMSDRDLASRFLSGATGYSNMEIKRGKVDFNQVANSFDQLNNLAIMIDNSASLGIFELRSKVKKLIVKHGIKLVIVDYLQLMNQKAGNREQEISIISRGLKEIAMEFNLPVIVLSQLNRGVESRDDKRPRLSDLRESGAIEQDADIVCSVYRPAYYQLHECEINGKYFDSKGLVVLDFIKNRNGAIFPVPISHNEYLTVFSEKIDEIYPD